VLDEPTSALDAQAEYELFAWLRSLAEGRTRHFHPALPATPWFGSGS